MSHPQNERIQDNLIDLIEEREWEKKWELENVAQYPDAYDIARDLKLMARFKT